MKNQEHCHQSEEWIVQMQVDSLSRGRKQPFYHIISRAGTAYCWFQFYYRKHATYSTIFTDVSEENIEPVRITPELAHEFIHRSPSIGQHFKTIIYASSKIKYGYMIPINYLREAYPDDEAVSRKYV